MTFFFNLDVLLSRLEIVQLSVCVYKFVLLNEDNFNIDFANERKIQNLPLYSVQTVQSSGLFFRRDLTTVLLDFGKWNHILFLIGLFLYI